MGELRFMQNLIDSLGEGRSLKLLKLWLFPGTFC